MKFNKKSLLLVFLTLIIAEIGCTKINTEAHTISLIHQYGEGDNIICIGYNEIKLDSVYYGLLNQSSEKYNFRSQAKYLISRKAIQYLVKYIDANCYTVDQKSKEKMAVFIVDAYPNEGQTCYYYSNEEMRNYLIGMNNWLEKSEFKEEFKEVIKQLRFKIEKFDNR